MNKMSEEEVIKTKVKEAMRKHGFKFYKGGRITVEKLSEKQKEILPGDQWHIHLHKLKIIDPEKWYDLAKSLNANDVAFDYKLNYMYGLIALP